ncbi:MAG: bifunctional 5,10-methylenetetrahydrofolate dehydrogenase/5,10-methenyltetrahydrofolate cyclohydrolase [Spirochaetaceae bacterium]|jgi:methylenetetrahydrofolate dehydrogenase (NADP+)/methenyltetrahydrofolate cyclohydrolase|nr:bifunctional 5,10-methylenetetrahydrofolate dehydrogenase/5,10-methenyltetrahydrofolate cyclohydrolase [Spirochaetaceae bacterium]
MGLLSGKDLSEDIKGRLKKDIEDLKRQGITPTLGIIRLGEEAGDISYEKGAVKICTSVDAQVEVSALRRETSLEKLLLSIQNFNEQDHIHGILIFRPLPKGLDDNAVRAALLPSKDMDGITDSSMAGLYSGTDKGFPPCTAEAAVKLLEYYNIELSGKNVVVVGRSMVIGKPVSMLLLQKDATVTICHSKTKDLQKKTREADIVIVAMGQAQALGKEYFRAGQYLIDIGVNAKPNGEKGTCGDLCLNELEPLVAGISPVPGGVGAVTSAVLVSHLVSAAKLTLTRGQ